MFVDDVNDNAPRFELDEYVFRLLESPSSGMVVGQTAAIDLDQMTSGDIEYSLKTTGELSDTFAIKRVVL